MIGFNVAGVVVRFHFENNGLTVANINNTCVLTGAADHLGAGGGQRAKPFFGGLIRAVLVPHSRKNTQFSERWGTADDLKNAVVFVGGKPVCSDQIRRECGFGHGAKSPLCGVGYLLEQL